MRTHLGAIITLGASLVVLAVGGTLTPHLAFQDLQPRSQAGACPTFTEDFNNRAQSDWPTPGSQSGNFTTSFTDDGRFQITLKGLEDFLGAIAPTGGPIPLADCAITVDVQQVLSGQLDNQDLNANVDVGLVIAKQQGRSIRVMVNVRDQTLSVIKREDVNEEKKILARTAISEVEDERLFEANAFNNIRIVARNGQATVLINDVLVTDKPVDLDVQGELRGEVGLFVIPNRRDSTDDDERRTNTQTLFDNFSVGPAESPVVDVETEEMLFEGDEDDLFADCKEAKIQIEDPQKLSSRAIKLGLASEQNFLYFENEEPLLLRGELTDEGGTAQTVEICVNPDTLDLSEDHRGTVSLTAQTADEHPLQLIDDSITVEIRPVTTSAAVADRQGEDGSEPLTALAQEGPTLDVSPERFDFDLEEGEDINAVELTLTVSGASDKTFLRWTTSDNQPWIDADKPGGKFLISGPAGPRPSVNKTIKIPFIDIIRLPVNETHGAEITVEAGKATNSPIVVPVTVTINSPKPPAVLEVNKSSLSFEIKGGSTDTVRKRDVFEIRNTGGRFLDWGARDEPDVEWLSFIGPSSGTLAPDESQAIEIGIDPENLTSGEKETTIVIEALVAQAKGSPAPVKLTLMVPPAVLNVSRSSLDLQVTEGRTELLEQESVLEVSNTGDSVLNWTAHEEPSVAWLESIRPARGSLKPGESEPVSVTINPSGLAVGTKDTDIVFEAESPAAEGSPVRVSTTLRVTRRLPPPEGNPLLVTQNGASFSGSGHGTLVEIDIGNPLIPTSSTIMRRLDTPADAVCGPENNRYFVDWATGDIHRVDPNGRDSEVLGTVENPEGVTFSARRDLYVSAADGIWRLEDGEGAPEQAAPTYTSDPGGLVFLTDGPHAGDLIAVDTADDRIVRFDAPDFDEATPFITDELDTPIGIAVDSTGKVYVSNFPTKKIQVYSPTGTFLKTLGEDITLRPFRPIHMEFGPNDTLFIAEWGDFVGQGWVAEISLSSGLTLIKSLTDAWGVGLC